MKEVWLDNVKSLGDFFNNVDEKDLIDIYKVCSRHTSERSQDELRKLMNQSWVIFRNEMVLDEDIEYISIPELKKHTTTFVMAVTMVVEQNRGNVEIHVDDKDWYLYKNFFVTLTPKGEKLFNEGRISIPVNILRK